MLEAAGLEVSVANLLAMDTCQTRSLFLGTRYYGFTGMMEKKMETNYYRIFGSYSLYEGQPICTYPDPASHM